MSNNTYQTKNFTFKLEHPFKDIHGNEVKEISIRRPTVGDTIANERDTKNLGANEQNLFFFSMLSGHSRETLEGMDLQDWVNFMKGSNSFLGVESEDTI